MKFIVHKESKGSGERHANSPPPAGGSMHCIERGGGHPLIRIFGLLNAPSPSLPRKGGETCAVLLCNYFSKLFLLGTLGCLTSCASQPQSIVTPMAVDMPVPVLCQAPQLAPVPDKMSALPKTTSLTAFTKACAEQLLLDRAYTAQLQAALKACGPFTP